MCGKYNKKDLLGKTLFYKFIIIEVVDCQRDVYYNVSSNVHYTMNVNDATSKSNLITKLASTDNTYPHHTVYNKEPYTGAYWIKRSIELLLINCNLDIYGIE